MKDLITPSLPLTAGSVGWNSEGSPIAVFADTSTIAALASFLVVRLFDRFASTAESLLSTPFVSGFAAQFTAQLHGPHSQPPRPT